MPESAPTTHTPTSPASTADEKPAPDRSRLWRLGAIAATATIAAHLVGFVALPGADTRGTLSGIVPPAADTAQLDAAETSAAAADNPVVVEQERALAHLRSTGSLDMWRPADARVIGAGSGPTAVLSGIVDGVCLYAAIDRGIATGVSVDPTQAACTVAAVDAARTELASSAAAARADADARAASRLAVAVEGAKMWAASNYVDGMPSFAGIPGEVAPGVFTVSFSTVEVVLEARTADGGCARAAVTSAGFVSELACP